MDTGKRVTIAWGVIHGKAEKRVFTDEFRADAVRLCASGERTIPQVARDLDLTVTVLRDWMRKAEAAKPT